MKKRLLLIFLLLMNLALSAQIVIMPAMQAVQYIRTMSAKSSAVLGDDGTQQYATVTSDFMSGTTMTDYGICWGTSTNPTTSTGTKVSYGSGTGTFNKVSTLSNLRAVTIYYIRPYIISSTGTFYGEEITLSTVPMYYLTNDVQTYTVPAGVTKIQIECWGAQGVAYSGGTWTATGGYGAYVKGDLAVTTGQILYVLVGGQPFNGGGNNVYPGGGASDVRTSASNLSSRLIVAGGGGGGPHWNGKGGDGGITVGGTGDNSSVFNTNGKGGAGGTQTAGGAGGAGTTGAGTAGSFGQGGIGRYDGNANNGIAGDGGGGWYGGGGGGGSGKGYYSLTASYYPEGGGGGGGSSYLGGVTSGTGTPGLNGNPAGYSPANGKVKITVIP